MKVYVNVGYTKNFLCNYLHWDRKNLIGTDVRIIDGKRNKIEISSRENGSRITLNGKDIFCSGEVI